MQHATGYIPCYRMHLIEGDLSREYPPNLFLRDMNISYLDRPAVDTA